MKIIYSNKQTQKFCEDYKHAAKRMSNQVADKLMDLLNAIESFPTLLDFLGLPQYRLHALYGNRNNQYSLVIARNTKWRLIVYPLDENEQVLTDRSNERQMLSKAVAVEIVEVSEHYA